MNAVILAHKYRTETMAVCMDRISREYSLSPDIKATYAGRLDPMAEGLVVFLVGDMRFHKPVFLHVSKTYDVQFFLGYETDTYDVLGLLTKTSDNTPDVSSEDIVKFQPLGDFTQSFPVYSSRKVSGKPLFAHARENPDDNIPVQEHTVTINNYSSLTQSDIASSEVVQHILSDIEKVDGDFRQDEITASWKKLGGSFSEYIKMYSITISCSSGFYVRQWVHDLGKYLHSGAVTFSISRTNLGEFTSDDLQGKPSMVIDQTDPRIKSLII